jgi:hypothetical protein
MRDGAATERRGYKARNGFAEHGSFGRKRLVRRAPPVYTALPAAHQEIMNRTSKPKFLKATPEERALIARLTAKSAFERLDAGEVELVSPDDWTDVPQLEPRVSLHIPKDLYQKVVKASRKRRITPERLAAIWIAKHVKPA